MDATTVKTLEDMRDGLFSLARAHRSVIPPPEVTAGQLAMWGATLGKILTGNTKEGTRLGIVAGPGYEGPEDDDEGTPDWHEGISIVSGRTIRGTEPQDSHPFPDGRPVTRLYNPETGLSSDVFTDTLRREHDPRGPAPTP